MGYARFVLDEGGGEELSLLAKDEGLGGAVAVVVVEWDGECCCCYCHGGYERGEEEAHCFFLFFPSSPFYSLFFVLPRFARVVWCKVESMEKDM